MLLRLWPCSLGGLIKGGKATSRVLQRAGCTCRACELLAQRGLAQVCLCFLKCSRRAITSLCQVLSIAHHFGIVQVFPQDYSPFQRCQLGRFCVQGLTVHLPPGTWRCSLCGTAVSAGQWQQTLAEGGGTDGGASRGSHAPCQVQVTAGAEPEMSSWLE